MTKWLSKAAPARAGTLALARGDGFERSARFWFNPHSTKFSSFSDGWLARNTPVVVIEYDATYDVTQVLSPVGLVWVFHCDLRRP